MTAGYCAWHQGMADDVALIVVHEQGSGAGGGAYACLPCARPLVDQWSTSADAVEAIAAPEKRAAAAAALEARHA
ncbi:hypothetical protein [Streptomyces spirodelae]|uniref:Uncharacterized protein n=1 Tax=Streptomyces spirodelae TaxID=2812904 RepID=A0ABS3WN59_9ACTN|nr:hypothetical protein [Streptomyces spirodelae]MBO8184563.1 hypothetical protein [Streptomyces spirodelae]